jgi:hypothetical protein
MVVLEYQIHYWVEQRIFGAAVAALLGTTLKQAVRGAPAVAPEEETTKQVELGELTLLATKTELQIQVAAELQMVAILVVLEEVDVLLLECLAPHLQH